MEAQKLLEKAQEIASKKAETRKVYSVNFAEGSRGEKLLNAIINAVGDSARKKGTQTILTEIMETFCQDAEIEV